MPAKHHVLTDAQKAAEYYRFAYTCETMKATGCPGNCMNCQFNVSLYVDDPREAVLIKSSAQIDFARDANKQQDETTGKLMMAGLIIAFCIFLAVKCDGSDKKEVARATLPIQEHTVNVSYPSTQELSYVYNEYQTYTLSEAFRVVRRSIIDINNDGLINCIDYAISFKLLWGENCTIVLNENKRTGMNHLFNAVKTPEGSWAAIEPQGTPNRYLMSVVWSSTYDPYYDVDETEYWLGQIVNYP